MTASPLTPESVFIGICKKLLWISFLFICFASIVGFFGEFDWRLDLFSHFRLQYLIAFSIIMLVSGLLKMRLLIVVSALLVVIQLFFFAPFYYPDKSEGSPDDFLILMANVEKGNTEHERLISYVEHVKPDIIILAEVDPIWAHALVSFKENYPYGVAEVRDDYSGMLMLSNKPLGNPRIERLGKRQLPTVTAEATISGKLVTIMGTHPFPPFGAWSDALRNEQLASIGEYIAEQKTPVILVGDLNSSPFSYPYRLLMSKAPLTNCAAGFGYQTTWHYSPHLPPFGLSIDHCLHTPGIMVTRSEVGQDIGSDHRPILNWFSQ